MSFPPPHCSSPSSQPRPTLHLATNLNCTVVPKIALSLGQGTDARTSAPATALCVLTVDRAGGRAVSVSGIFARNGSSIHRPSSAADAVQTDQWRGAGGARVGAPLAAATTQKCAFWRSKIGKHLLAAAADDDNIDNDAPALLVQGATLIVG